MTRRHTAPGNQTVAVVPYFAPDTAGAAMFAGILGGNGLGLADQLRPTIDARGRGAFHGPINGVQTVEAHLGSGAPIVPASTRLDQTSGSALSDPVQSIFTQRMAARRFG